MNIICLTKDSFLTDKLATLYEAEHLKIFSDFNLVDGVDLQNTDILIVDLRDCLVPKSISIPIMTLAATPTFQEAVAVLQCGAKGYGNRHMRKTNLRQAIESVQIGQIWLPPSFIIKLLSKVKGEILWQSNNSVLGMLSKREQEVALCVAEGMSNQEMADKMYVSLRTVKAHLSSIYDKSGLRNRLELGLRLKNT